MELEKDPSLMISSESTGSSHHQSGPICPLVPLVPVVTNLHQSDSLVICARAFSLFSSQSDNFVAFPATGFRTWTSTF